MSPEAKPPVDAVSRVVIDAHRMDFYSPGEMKGGEKETCSADDAHDDVADDVSTERDEVSDTVARTPRGGSGPAPVDRGLLLAAQPPKAKEIVAALERSDGMSIADLAAELDVHANTVRAHVDDLLAAGLIKRRPKRSGGRGRPQWIYSAVGKGTNHEALMRMLSAYVRDSADDPAGEARHIGRTYFEPLDDDGEKLEASRDPHSSLRKEFAEQGFSPEVAPGGLRLKTCPVLDAARENPEVVCGMHLGMAQRLWAELGGEGEVGLCAFDGPGWCAVQLPDSESDQD